MINFIFGAKGCGKTFEIINMLRRDAEAGIPSILIVPEQEAVQAERLTLEQLPPEAQLSLEVLNFSRLYNRVCREYGGLCYSYVTSPLKHIIMWKTLSPSQKIFCLGRERSCFRWHYAQHRVRAQVRRSSAR